MSNSQTAAGKQRRSGARRALELPNGVEIRTSQGVGPRSFMAQLVDFSAGGMGVETFVGLQPGERVKVRAAFTNAELALGFSGNAKVVHALEVSPGRFRVGLELSDVAYQKAS